MSLFAEPALRFFASLRMTTEGLRAIRSGANRLSRNSTHDLSYWNDLEVQGSSLFLEPFDLVLPVFFLVIGDAFVHVGLAVFQHSIQEAGQFVGHGGDGFGGSQPGAQAAEIRSQGAPAAPQRLGCQP